MPRRLDRWLFCAALSALCLAAPAARAQVAPPVRYAGILTEAFSPVMAFQARDQWCWAASIQMVLGYYGVTVPQEAIVRRTYGADPHGRLPNWPASQAVITRNLNGWAIDGSGRRHRVYALYGPGAPHPGRLLRELEARKPVLVGYDTGQGGHAVVVTAASYEPTPQGPVIRTLVLRDPFPRPGALEAGGRREVPGDTLACDPCVPANAGELPVPIWLRVSGKLGIPIDT